MHLHLATQLLTFIKVRYYNYLLFSARKHTLYITSIINIGSTSIPSTLGCIGYVKCLISALEAFKFIYLESRKGKIDSTLLYRQLRVLLGSYYVSIVIVIVLVRNNLRARLAQVLVVYVIQL
jgi:hypothetical protein